MTKYKFKVATTWGKKGDELKDNNIDIMGFWGIQRLKVAPSSYPDLFEEIIEKTNEEKIFKVIKNEYFKFISIPRYSPHIYSDYIEFFKKLPEILDRLGFNADAAYNEICDKK